jgi:hypothetical protein
MFSKISGLGVPGAGESFSLFGQQFVLCIFGGRAFSNA